MTTVITARQLAKNDARARAFKRFYAIFDHLESACREATREAGEGWDKSKLRRCKARVCDHLKKDQHPPLHTTCAHV